MHFSTEIHTQGDAVPFLRNRRGIALGIAVSLLLHAGLIYVWRAVKPPAIPDTGPRVESVAVWIRPLAAKPLPPPPIAEAKPKHEPKPISAPRKTISREDAPRITAQPPSQNMITIAPTAPPAPVATPDALAKEAPKFDMDAALKTARKVAGERDPSKVGTAVGQIPDKPLQTETQLARDIAEGKRGDCRTAYAGAGILAPVLMLLDKKDSGCKW
ncbi:MULTISPECIES: hypothetical protein [unclassified Janthinobacterium]|uniref:hypothetical protein n=1 Tax=unclassified Janthinobacterium TaxID=2610881 RepID=UPI001616993A|nr:MULTISPECIES: hypothetical protein [unclassified Janthinobacterium]MBB5609670.1 hypothetical protein [Janthinobacterium sp. S3T4]MBB5614842.1 hypothetical protein [Janthinobacterium sp. S3M3]